MSTSSTPPPTALDWRSGKHWGGRRLPCVHCGKGAFCRDEQGRPAHKTCAETALTHRGEHAIDDLTEGAA